MIHAEISAAANYTDLMNNVRLFASGIMSRGYSGVGNGILKSVDLGATPVRETWTITATAIVTVFDVVGSVSGSVIGFETATVGTAYDNGIIKFTIQAGGVTFVVGDAFTLTVWQITDAVVGVGKVAVTAGGTGATSGNLIFTGGGYSRIAAGTYIASAGVIVSTTITDRGAGYTSEPTVTADSGAGATLTPSLMYPWDTLRHSAYDGTNMELIMMGQGDGGLDEIYVGIKNFTGTSTEGNIYNWKLNGFSGFGAATAFEEQAGGMKTPTTYNLTAATSSTWPSGSTYSYPTRDLPPFISLDSSATPIEYWLTWGGRYITLVAKVAGGASYEPIILGLGKQLMTTGQFPMPLIVGGSHTGRQNLWRYSHAGSDHSAFPDAAGSSNISPLRYRHIDGAWRTLFNRDTADAITLENNKVTWPWIGRGIANLRDNIDGSHTLFPVIAGYGDAMGVGDILFELPGIFAVPGRYFGAARAYPYTGAGTDQAAENKIGTKYVIFPNAYRTDYDRFFALQVED